MNKIIICIATLINIIILLAVNNIYSESKMLAASFVEINII